MKICSYCQNAIEDDDMFCTECGAPYEENLIQNNNISNKGLKYKNHIPSALLIFSIIIFMISEELYLVSLALTFIAIFIWNKQKNFAENPISVKLPQNILDRKNNLLENIHGTDNPSVVKIRPIEGILLFILGLFLLGLNDIMLIGIACIIIAVFVLYRSEGKLKQTRLDSIDFTKRSKFPLFITYLGLINLFYILFFQSKLSGWENQIIIPNTIALISLGLIIYCIQPPDQLRKENNIFNQFLTVIFLILAYSLVSWYDLYLGLIELSVPVVSVVVGISAVLLMKYPSIDETVFDLSYKTKSVIKSRGYTAPQRYQLPINTPNILSEKLDGLENRHNRFKTEFETVEQEILTLIPEKINKINQDITKGDKHPNVLRRVLESAKADTKLARDGIEIISNNLDQLKADASTNYITDQLDEMELKIKEMRERIPLINEKIDNEEVKFKKSSLVLHSDLSAIDVKIIEMEKAMPIVEPIPAKLIPLKKQRYELKPQRVITTKKVKTKPQIDYSTASFKLKSLISEKTISNLFAYVGALLITLGVFFGISFSFTNFILPEFPDDVDEGKAIIGTGIIYLFGLLLISSLFLPRIKSKLTGVSRFITSLGLVILQFAFIIQTVYFINLNLDFNYLIYPGIILVMAGLVTGYLLRSQLISVVAVGIGVLNGFMMGDSSVLQDTLFGGNGGPFAIFFFNTILLVICVLLVLRRKIWLPLVVFSLLSPVIWQTLNAQSTIMTPSYLALLVSCATVYIVIRNKMPTPKPFSHFLGLLFMIYPNIMSIIYTVDRSYLQQSPMSSLQIFNTIIIFSSFYILYWVFVFFEKDIELSFDFPVSFDFSSEKLKMRPIQQRLNWLLLTSLVLLFTIVFILRETGNYDPIIFFALLLAAVAGVGIKLDFNKYVKNSIILMLIMAEVVFILSLANPNASSIGISVVTAIFLVSFLSNYQIINRYRRTINLYKTKISPYLLAVFISVFSIINFILAGESEEFGTLVLLLSAITWISLTVNSLTTKKKDALNAKIAHTGIISGLAFLFLYGLIRQDRRFPIDRVTRSMSALTHSTVNLSLGLYLIFALVMIIFGSNLKYNKTVPSTFRKTKSFFVNAKQLIVPDQLYTSHIIIFALPSILIAFGFPYFYYPTINQAVLLLYFMVYFLLLPVLVIISRIKRNHVFGTLAAFTGYFAFLGGFILLGGAKKLYDIIVQPPTSSARGLYFIDPAWAIFLIVALFIGTVSWVIALSNKPLKRDQIPKSEKDEDKPDLSDKSEEAEKEEIK